MNSKKLVLRLYPKMLLISFIIILLLVFYILDANDISVPLISYWDELLTIISLVYCGYLGLNKKLYRYDVFILIVFIIIAVIGFLSNIVNRITTDLSSILVDFVALMKLPAPFLAAKYLAAEDKHKNIAGYMRGISKLFIFAAFIFGTISLFVDLGMSGEERYGIESFYFITYNEGRLGLITAAMLLIILMTEKNRKKQIFYEFCSIMVMLYTTKGTIYIIVIVYLLLLIMWRKSYKLKPGNIIVLVAGILSASVYQIRTYLTNLESPRMIFLRYGFVTANNYFPLGSGFSTFGSAEAGKNYSSLYYLYGFDDIWGLSQEYDMFLNDCYIGMIVGQFGYIGLVLFIIGMLLIFLLINRSYNLSKQSKALVLGVFLALVVSSVGSAIIKSEIGVFCFIVIGLYIGYANQYQSHNLANRD